VKEIAIDGSVEEVYNRVRTALDPFFVRADDETLVRTTADEQEDDDPLPWGEYGPYCPVTLRQEGWLLSGKNEFEVYVQGRRHRFFSEKEAQIFRERVAEYYIPN
jgi:adenylate/nucleoside-diphosphate kinase